MPYPDNFSWAAYDAAQGIEDEDAEDEAAARYENSELLNAARDLLYAMDRGFLNPMPDNKFIKALRLEVQRTLKALGA